MHIWEDTVMLHRKKPYIVPTNRVYLYMCELKFSNILARYYYGYDYDYFSFRNDTGFILFTMQQY